MAPHANAAPDFLTHVENSETLKGGIDLSGEIHLDADAETVWRILTLCDMQLRYVPGLTECEVLRTGRETILDDMGQSVVRVWDERKQTLDYAFPFPTLRTELRAVYTPGERIDFAASGGDVRDLKGHWSLEPHPQGGTQVRYRASFRSGLPVPRSLVRRSTAKDLPKLFERLRAVTRETVG